jgi:hypothetical protein
LTDEEDNGKYGLIVIEIMKDWANQCYGNNYEPYSGTSMLIVRSLFPMLSAYDFKKTKYYGG